MFLDNFKRWCEKATADKDLIEELVSIKDNSTFANAQKRLFWVFSIKIPNIHIT